MSLTLTSNEVKLLVEVYKLNPTVELRNIIAKLNIGLARLVAHEFANRYSEAQYCDFEQEASIALIKSIDLFQIERGASFSNYSITYIRGHLQHYIRDKRQIIRVPQKVHDLHKAVKKLTLTENLTVSEIAVKLNSTEQKIKEAMCLKQVVGSFSAEELDSNSAQQEDSYQYYKTYLPCEEIKELIDSGLKNKELWDAINEIA